MGAIKEDMERLGGFLWIRGKDTTLLYSIFETDVQTSLFPPLIPYYKLTNFESMGSTNGPSFGGGWFVEVAETMEAARLE